MMMQQPMIVQQPVFVQQQGYNMQPVQQQVYTTVCETYLLLRPRVF